MEIQKNARNNWLWTEITDQKGFLIFGDLSLYQRERGTNLSSIEADVICENCPHKYRFKKEESWRNKNKWKSKSLELMKMTSFFKR